MTRHRNIIRIDDERSHTHAWRVTLQRRNEIVIKHFSDGRHGGKRKALAAAIEYRDSFLAENSAEQHQLWLRTRIRKNNRSGIPGVARYEVLANPRTGRREALWVAFWSNEQGIRRSRKFHVSCHGERRAKLLAIAERERQLSRVCAIKGSGA